MRWRAGASILAAVLVCGCNPDIYSDAGMRKLERVSHRIDDFDFVMERAQQPLWQGKVRVSRFAASRLKLEGSTAGDSACQDWKRTFGERYTAQMDVKKYGGNANDPDRYEFAAWIEQTRQAANCTELIRESHTAREVRKVSRGQEIVIKGSGDLVVRFRRTR